MELIIAVIHSAVNVLRRFSTIPVGQAPGFPHEKHKFVTISLKLPYRVSDSKIFTYSPRDRIKALHGSEISPRLRIFSVNQPGHIFSRMIRSL